MNGLGKSCSAQSFGWERLRVFLAVAERGSLSAAATHLGISQPTASRQIQSLEAELDVQLFARASRKMLLTEAGLTLLEPAREMARAAERFALLAAGRETSLAGVVRITASQVVATYLLPSMLVRLRQAEPSIELEVVASNATDNLLAREADIAIRMYRPTQQEVVTTHIRDLEIGAFAAHSYLRRRGVPTSIDDFQQHDFVGYDRDDLLVRGFRTVGYEVQRRDFPFRTDNQVVFWHAVVAGMGIGFMPC
ncbi:MAG: LysR family transcriptional regulator, partial [Myxococcota bacterium]